MDINSSSALQYVYYLTVPIFSLFVSVGVVYAMVLFFRRVVHI